MLGTVHFKHVYFIVNYISINLQRVKKKCLGNAIRFCWMLIYLPYGENGIFPLYITCISQVSMKLAQMKSNIDYNLYFTWVCQHSPVKDFQDCVCFELDWCSCSLNFKLSTHTTGLAKPTLFWGSLFCKDEEIWTLWVSELPKGTHL